MEGSFIKPDPNSFSPISRPFLKWAGGKRWLIKKIIYFLPEKVNYYFEPFFGGGALFFSIGPRDNMSFIADKNSELINCYNQVIKNPEDIIAKLSRLKYDKSTYYTLRDSPTSSNIEKAVNFIYLNKTGWNGLYRVNSEGKNNVPFGKFPQIPNVCPSKEIRKASKLMKEIKISKSDFEKTVGNASKNDFVYFDPPYTVKHNNNSFKYYNEKVFSWDDQIRLSEIAKKLSDEGVNVLISNANHEDIRNLYRGFNIFTLSRSSVISGFMNSRGKIQEILISSYKPKLPFEYKEGMII